LIDSPVHRFVNNCIIHAGYRFECAVQKTDRQDVSHTSWRSVCLFLLWFICHLRRWSWRYWSIA